MKLGCVNLLFRGLRRSPRIASGFSFVELMVVVALLGIVLMIALPNLTEYQSNQRTYSMATLMKASLAQARSTAVSRHVRVTVCPSVNGSACTTGWGNGWIVFTDGGTQGVVDGTDVVLRAVNAATGVGITAASNYTNYVSYLSTGRTVGSGGTNSGGGFNFCGSGSADRGLVISSTGYVSSGVPSC